MKAAEAVGESLVSRRSRARVGARHARVGLATLRDELRREKALAACAPRSARTRTTSSLETRGGGERGAHEAVGRRSRYFRRSRRHKPRRKPPPPLPPPRKILRGASEPGEPTRVGPGSRAVLLELRALERKYHQTRRRVPRAVREARRGARGEHDVESRLRAAEAEPRRYERRARICSPPPRTEGAPSARTAKDV